MMRNLGRNVRIDWARLIDEIRARDMTLHQIADRVGIGYGALRSYRYHPSKDGDVYTEPSYWVGVSLLALWAEKTEGNAINAPTRRIPLSISRILKEHA